MVKEREFKLIYVDDDDPKPFDKLTKPYKTVRYNGEKMQLQL